MQTRRCENDQNVHGFSLQIMQNVYQKSFGASSRWQSKVNFLFVCTATRERLFFYIGILSVFYWESQM